jgi:hypothetical protein
MENNWRYELKYKVNEYHDSEVIYMIKSHPAMFSEIYYERQVNNIYFDTPKYEYFSDNVIGISNRLKMRVRWYGDTFCFIKHPVLELKIKESSVGRKEKYPMSPFSFTGNTGESILYNSIENDSSSILLKRALLVTKPVLLNCYTRRYYISSCGRFRLTYDKNIGFYEYSNKNGSKKYISDRILEIKLDKKNIIYVKNIMEKYPFRLSKYSKYVTGVNELIMMPYIY